MAKTDDFNPTLLGIDGTHRNGAPIISIIKMDNSAFCSISANSGINVPLVAE